jgi:Ran-binding protein 3
MSKDSIKRKLELAELNETKKLKPEACINCEKAVIEELKSEIIKQVSTGYETKISKLEQEIRDLRKLVINHEKSANSGEKIEESVEKSEEPVEKSSNKPSLVPKVPKFDKSNDKPTFGTSSFNINPVIATPSNSILSQNTTTPKDSESKQNSPKPKFGSSISFSSTAFENMKNKKNIFDTSSDEASKKPETFGSFGANSKFGDAFQKSLTKKSFLDSPESNENNINNHDYKVGDKPTPQQFKQVDLEPIKSVQTGEEDEISLYNTNAKLFELDFSNISEGWKERGAGPLHLNQSKQDKNQIRLVMRSNGLLRVILNYKITKETELLKGLEASLNPGKYLRLNSINSSGTPIQYMLKFASQSIRDSVVENAENVKNQIPE